MHGNMNIKFQNTITLKFPCCQAAAEGATALHCRLTINSSLL